MIKYLTGELPSLILGSLVVTLVCLLLWYNSTPDLKWITALSGFSPIDWINHHNLPENFSKDFPQGSYTYDASLFMHVYKVADQYMGTSPETLMPGVILFEMLFMGFASIVFFKATIKKTSGVAAFIFAILVLNSGVRSVELAGFGGPFFAGLYYNFADGMRLIAIAMVIKRKLIAAALFFALSVMTHPIMGIVGGIFALGYLYSNYGRSNLSPVIQSFSVFLLIAGSWWIYHTSDVDIASKNITPETWVSFAEAFSFHFFPIQNGLLSFSFERRMLGFCSLLLLSIYFVFQKDQSYENKKGMMIGAALLLITTISGLCISYWSDSPTLIRLCLIRASDMLILVALAVVVAGLVQSLKTGNALQAAVAGGLLVAPFMGPPYPVLYVALTIGLGMPLFKQKGLNCSEKVILALLVAFCVLLLIYFQLGYVNSNYKTAYVGQKYLWLLSLFILFSCLVSSFFPIIKGKLRKAVFIFVTLLIFPIAMQWRATVNFGTAEKPMGLAFLEAQVWAKENTPITSLFMVDPTIHYGWRDFSQRSSFGNLREWLHTSWLYDSREANHEEGIQRVVKFGISIEDFLNQSPPNSGFEKLNKEIREQFYSFEVDWFRQMAVQYDINYLVMKKSNMRSRLPLPVKHENEFFVVYGMSNQI